MYILSVTNGEWITIQQDVKYRVHPLIVDKYRQELIFQVQTDDVENAKSKENVQFDAYLETSLYDLDLRVSRQWNKATKRYDLVMAFKGCPTFVQERGPFTMDGPVNYNLIFRNDTSESFLRLQEREESVLSFQKGDCDTEIGKRWFGNDWHSGKIWFPKKQKVTLMNMLKKEIIDDPIGK